MKRFGKSFSKEKSKKAMSSTLIYGIIAVFLLVISIIFLNNAWSSIFSGFKEWNSLGEMEQKEIENNFQAFYDNMKECKNINDRFCKCEKVFPNFPNSFRDEVSIDILQENVNIRLLLNYNKNKIENSEKDAGLGSLFFVRRYKEDIPAEAVTGEITIKGKDIQEIREENSKLEITFDKDYPEILGKDKKYGMASGDVFRGDFANVLYLIVDDKEFFDEYPKCVDSRYEAIEAFDSLIKNLGEKNEIMINLPEDYRIFYSGKTIKLEYKEKEIERIYDSDKKKMDKKEVAKKTYAFNIKCSESDKEDYLIDGNKINIKRAGNGFCIEKANP